MRAISRLTSGIRWWFLILRVSIWKRRLKSSWRLSSSVRCNLPSTSQLDFFYRSSLLFLVFKDFRLRLRYRHALG